MLSGLPLLLAAILNTAALTWASPFSNEGLHPAEWVVKPRADDGGLHWLGEKTVPTSSMSESPSAVVYNDLLYVFYQGVNENNQLKYNTFDGETWYGEETVPNMGLSESPSATVYNGLLWVFHQGGSESGILGFNRFNGQYWYGDAQAPQTNLSCSPSATAFGDDLFEFQQTPSKTGGMSYDIFKGGVWTGPSNVPSTGMSESPSAVTANITGLKSPVLYVFHQAWGDGLVLWYNSFDGTTWHGDVELEGTYMTGSPSAAVFDNSIYCFHEKNEGLWYNAFNGTEWSGDTQVPSTFVSSSPSAVVYNNALYVFHQSPSNTGQLWYNVLSS